MRAIFIFILVTLIAGSGFSQEVQTWDLNRCIQYALEKNLDLKVSRNLEERAVLYRQQSQLNLLPTLNGWGSSSFDFRRSTNQNNEISSGPTYNTSYGISTSLKLFAGFTNLNSIAAYRFNELAEKESTKQAINNLIISVTEKYSLVVYQQALVQVQKEQLNTSKVEAERISALIASGLLEEVALSEIEATVSGYELQLNRAENEYQLQKLQLAQLIEWPDITNFELSQTGFVSVIPQNKALTADEVYEQACRSYPSIREKEYELNYCRKQLHISMGQMAPSLSLSGGYSSAFYSTDTLANGRQTPVGTQFGNYLNPSVGLSLSFPIFNARSRYYNVKRSRIDLENALFSLENQKKLIRREIEEGLLKLESFRIEYQYASNNLIFAEKSFETYREKYRLGLITTTDFMSAQNQLAQAKTGQLQAQFSWIVQKQTIELFRGQTINTK